MIRFKTPEECMRFSVGDKVVIKRNGVKGVIVDYDNYASTIIYDVESIGEAENDQGELVNPAMFYEMDCGMDPWLSINHLLARSDSCGKP